MGLRGDKVVQCFCWKQKHKKSIEVFKWNWLFSWLRWFPAGRCRNSGKIYRDEGTSNLPNAALIPSRRCCNLFSIFHRTSKWCSKRTASGWAGSNRWILQDFSRRRRSILSVRPFSLSQLSLLKALIDRLLQEGTEDSLGARKTKETAETHTSNVISDYAVSQAS